MDEVEVPLEGGNSADGVVRVGSTVRKPWTSNTAMNHEFMTTVRAAGVDVPAVLGRDDRGRQIVEFVPGRLAMHSPPLELAELERVGRLIRSIHDAAADFRPTEPYAEDPLLPAPEEELICHSDLAPWNLIVGARWVFIDWDGAGPSSRLWDLAYSAQAFTLSDVNESVHNAAIRLAALVDGYGADDHFRERLPSTMSLRTNAMYELLYTSNLTGLEPWGSMFTEGHGEHWRSAADFVKRNEAVWREALRTNRSV